MCVWGGGWAYPGVAPVMLHKGVPTTPPSGEYLDVMNWGMANSRAPRADTA